MNPYFWLKNPKANFFKNWVTVSSCNTECYEADLDFLLKNPKANFFRNWVTVSSCNTEVYEADLGFSLKNPKAKTKPISASFSPQLYVGGFVFVEVSNQFQRRNVEKSEQKNWPPLSANGRPIKNCYS
jgi:hypothetical protein